MLTTLIYLAMNGLDLIIGMDWLSTNKVALDCSSKLATFPERLSLMTFSVEQPGESLPKRT
jgi:hypothetical protein